MLNKMCFTISFFIILSFSVSGQERIIRKEYLKIKPYESTKDDVEKIYGKGDFFSGNQVENLDITYVIDKHKRVSISYFRDCNQTDKPIEQRRWIVKDLYFAFSEDLKIKPNDIILDKKDFTACPYGDVGGQIIYFNKEKTIEFTYMSNNRAVSDLSIMATEKNKEKYKCKKDEVIVTLDPKGFRCNSPD